MSSLKRQLTPLSLLLGDSNTSNTSNTISQPIRLRFNQYPTPKQSMRVAVDEKPRGKGIRGAGFLANRGRLAAGAVAKDYQVRTFTDDEVKQYQVALTLAAKTQRPRGFQMLTGPLRMFVAYVFPPLKGHTAEERATLQNGGRVWKHTKPDVDSNLNKPLVDALQGVLFANDSQVARITAEKYYAADGPYILVEVGPVEKLLPLEIQFLHP